MNYNRVRATKERDTVKTKAFQRQNMQKHNLAKISEMVGTFN